MTPSCLTIFGTTNKFQFQLHLSDNLLHYPEHSPTQTPILFFSFSLCLDPFLLLGTLGIQLIHLDRYLNCLKQRSKNSRHRIHSTILLMPFFFIFLISQVLPNFLAKIQVFDYSQSRPYLDFTGQ